MSNLTYMFKDNKFSHLNKKVEKRIKEFYSDRIDALISELEECESPIEEILGLELMLNFENYYGGYEMGFEAIIVNKQHELDVNGIIYRSDFCIAVMGRNKNMCFIVECDGHDFHEKTKEQVARDKKRDRDISSLGHIVIRFSGSEIYKDVGKCVREIKDIIRNHMRGW